MIHRNGASHQQPITACGRLRRHALDGVGGCTSNMRGTRRVMTMMPRRRVHIREGPATSRYTGLDQVNAEKYNHQSDVPSSHRSWLLSAEIAFPLSIRNPKIHLKIFVDRTKEHVGLGELA
jgi:hypothetical protein